MDAPFPFGLPFPTAFYLTAYVVTLLIHVAFMNYVLAGTAYIAAVYLGIGRSRSTDSVRILKDWMPLMLSGAITAGVAPLLFVQVLYKQEFYTANLLLFSRWMAILPVLIVGFYAMYLLKSGWFSRQPAWVRTGVACVPILAVAFTGYSWTENHLLSVRGPEFWGRFYATQAQIYTEPQLLPRLLMWAVGSVPTLAVILAWQLWYHGVGRPARLAALAGGGLGAVALATAWYVQVADDGTRATFVSPLAAPYFVTACVGIALQVFGWLWVARANRPEARRLLVPTVGLFLTVAGMTVCREAVRIAALSPERFEALYPLHAAALGRGGFPVFVAFFTVNAGLVGLVFWLVRNRSQSANPTASGKTG